MNNKTDAVTGEGNAPRVNKRPICGSCLAKRGEVHRSYCQTETQRFLMRRIANKPL